MGASDCRGADSAALKAELDAERRRAGELEEKIRAYREAYDAARKELDSLCYAISHDLRAPLRAVAGFATALSEDCGESLGEDGREYLTRLVGATQRMIQMIEGLLELSRLMRAPRESRSVDLAAMSRSILDELCRRSPERRVRYSLPAGAIVEGDPDLLRVLMEALLENAWKFTAERPEARIEFGVQASSSGERVYFVRDNGVGFDMVPAGKLFAPFQRLHAAEEFPGLGLGLARARTVVRRHGGRIWAEARENAGATFFFTLSAPSEVNADRLA